MDAAFPPGMGPRRVMRQGCRRARRGSWGPAERRGRPTVGESGWPPSDGHWPPRRSDESRGRLRQGARRRAEPLYSRADRAKGCRGAIRRGLRWACHPGQPCRIPLNGTSCEGPWSQFGPQPTRGSRYGLGDASGTEPLGLFRFDDDGLAKGGRFVAGNSSAEQFANGQNGDPSRNCGRATGVLLQARISQGGIYLGQTGQILVPRPQFPANRRRLLRDRTGCLKARAPPGPHAFPPGFRASASATATRSKRHHSPGDVDVPSGPECFPPIGAVSSAVADSRERAVAQAFALIRRLW